MKSIKPKAIIPVISMMAIISLSSSPVMAQSTEATIGSIIGGSAGAAVGASIDNKGSNTEGALVGAAVGGLVGYVVGQGLEHDGSMKARYSSQAGVYHRHNGRSYRRYNDGAYGYVYIPIDNNDRYYYRDGRRKNIGRSHKFKKRGAGHHRGRKAYRRY